MTYYFDMDGTLADFYGVRNWLDYLRNKDTYPYEVARPLHRFASLARMLNRVQAEGNRIGIISWGAENTPGQYNREIAETKRRWLAKHLPSVDFDEIHITVYGLPKEIFKSDGDILFDDNENVRAEWGEGAYSPEEIFEILRKGA